jgi:hypothetical protein
VVAGKLVVAGTKTIFLPRGFVTDGVVYPTQYASTLCTQPNVAPGSKVADWLEDAQKALIAAPLPGLRYGASFRAMVQDWHANSVRFQVSQGALDYEYANGLSAYTDMVRGAIAQARAAGLIAFISMQSENYSCTPHQHGEIQKLPNSLTERAWKQLLDPTITNDRGVILEILNEPNTNQACSTGLPWPRVNWKDWAEGCGNDPNQGMLTVGQYVRELAPKNVLVFDADADAASFAGFVVPSGMPSNSAYAVHPYSYIYGIHDRKATSIRVWNERFGDFERSGNAVVVTEWNEDFKFKRDPGQTITDYFLKKYLPNHSMGMIAYAWDGPYWSSGYLVNSYSYSGNTATYLAIDPDNSGHPHNGAKELLREFRAQSAQQ